MKKHVAAMVDFWNMGVPTLDYGNNIRQVALDEGLANEIFISWSDSSDPTGTWQSLQFVADSDDSDGHDSATTLSLGADASGLVMSADMSNLTTAMPSSRYCENSAAVYTSQATSTRAHFVVDVLFLARD